MTSDEFGRKNSDNYITINQNAPNGDKPTSVNGNNIAVPVDNKNELSKLVDIAKKDFELFRPPSTEFYSKMLDSVWDEFIKKLKM